MSDITICHTLDAMRDMVENKAVYSCEAPLGYDFYTTNAKGELKGIHKDDCCLRPVKINKLSLIREDTMWCKIADTVPENYSENNKQRITSLDRRVDYVSHMKDESWRLYIDDVHYISVFKGSVCVIKDLYHYTFMVFNNERERTIVKFNLPLDSKITDIKPELIKAYKDKLIEKDQSAVI